MKTLNLKLLTSGQFLSDDTNVVNTNARQARPTSTTSIQQLISDHSSVLADYIRRFGEVLAIIPVNVACPIDHATPRLMSADMGNLLRQDTCSMLMVGKLETAVWLRDIEPYGTERIVATEYAQLSLDPTTGNVSPAIPQIEGLLPLSRLGYGVRTHSGTYDDPDAHFSMVSFPTIPHVIGDYPGGGLMTFNGYAILHRCNLPSAE